MIMIIMIIMIIISIDDIISDTTIKQQAINHLDEFKHRHNNEGDYYHDHQHHH